MRSRFSGLAYTNLAARQRVLQFLKMCVVQSLAYLCRITLTQMGDLVQCAGTLLALLYRRLLFSIAKVWHDEIRDKNNMLAGRILIVPIRRNVLSLVVVVVMLRQVSLWVALWNAFSVECMKTAASCKQTPLSNVLRSLSHFLSEAHPPSAVAAFFALSLYPNVLFWLELPSGYADMGVVGHNTHEVLSNFSRLC